MKSLTPAGMTVLADIVLFKLSWLLLVILRTAGIVPALVIVAWKASAVAADRRCLPLVAGILVTGLVMDGLLTLAGLFVFAGPFLPPWLVVLWLSFALTMARGFAFLQVLHPAWQSAAGALAGTLGYGAGLWLEAVATPRPAFTLAVVAVLWALLIPGVLAAFASLQARGETS